MKFSIFPGVSALIETPAGNSAADEIMAQSRQSVADFQRRLTAGSDAAAADLKRAKEEFSGARLFEEGQAIFDRMIREDSELIH